MPGYDVNTDDRGIVTERQGYHHGDLAAALLDAATDAVRSTGAHAFSLRGVAREVGVDIAAVYRHFTNRTHLLGAVALRGFAQLEARMRATIADLDDPEARLMGVGRAYVLFALDEPELFRLMFGPTRGEAALPDPTGKTFDGPYAVLLEALDGVAATRSGGLPRDAAALVAWSAVHGLAALVVDGPLDPAVARAQVDTLLRAVVVGIGPTAAFPAA